jgi:hypothetical protein
MATEINLLEDNVSVNNLTSTTTVTAASFTGDGSAITNLPTGTVTREIFKTALIDDATINDSTTFTSKNVFSTSPTINIGGFTVAASGVTVPSTGFYLCMVNAKEFSTLQRVNAAVKFTINGTIQSDIGASGYIRNLTNHSNSSVHIDTIFSLTAGDVVGLAFGLLGNTGTVTLEGANSCVCLYRIS